MIMLYVLFDNHFALYDSHETTVLFNCSRSAVLFTWLPLWDSPRSRTAITHYGLSHRPTLRYRIERYHVHHGILLDRAHEARLTVPYHAQTQRGISAALLLIEPLQYRGGTLDMRRRLTKQNDAPTTNNNPVRCFRTFRNSLVYSCRKQA